MNPDLPGGQQYCLKWNNHKKNISGVFERLRSNESFVDVTLASADQKILKCHRIVLSAGSGYLEDILSQNPSDHPTIVLSQINFDELKNLVDFMYAGEVAVEQNNLNNLLEAAKILKIKGLWESGVDPGNDSDEESEISPQQAEPASRVVPEEVVPALPVNPVNPVSPSMPELKSPPSLKAMMQEVGSKKRKRSRNGVTGSVEEIQDGPKVSKVVKKESPPPPTNEASPSKMYSPLFGVSNAYFLTQPPPLKTILENSSKAIMTDDAKSNVSSNPSSPALPDIPNLLSQTPVHPALISAINGAPLPFLPNIVSGGGPGSHTSSTQSDNDDAGKAPAKSGKFSNVPVFSSSAPVRRYKQYTEDTLQLALKEIMDGQSINRSSMKYNIPARTLRDWMKRLNIKSVFTHHSQSKDERNSGADSSHEDAGDAKLNSNVFPGMLSLGEAIRAQNKNSMSDSVPQLKGSDQDDETEEEEIDDDEEERLKVDCGDEN